MNFDKEKELEHYYILLKNEDSDINDCTKQLLYLLNHGIELLEICDYIDNRSL